MADHDAQRLITISLGKIANFNTQRRGCSLHKNLLVSTVIQRARTLIVDTPCEPVTNNEWLQQRGYYQHLQDSDVIANFNKLYVSEAVRWGDSVVPCETTGSGFIDCDETTTVVNMDNGITEIVRTYKSDADTTTKDIEPTLPCQSPHTHLPEITLQENGATELNDETAYHASSVNMPMDIARDDLNRKRRYLPNEEEIFSDFNHYKRQKRDNPFWLKQSNNSLNDDCESYNTETNEEEAEDTDITDKREPLHNSVNMINYLSLASDFSETHKSWTLDHSLLHYASESPYSTDFLVHNPSEFCMKRPADLFGTLPIDVTGQTLALTV